MQPEWIQDSKTKNLQPQQIPQYEAAGPQQDSENYRKALKLVVSRGAIAAVIIAVIVAAFQFRDAMVSHQSSFARLGQAGPSPYQNRIRLRLHSVKRSEKVQGFLFDSTAKAGFTYLIVELSVVNLAEKSFKLNVYSLTLNTADNQSYIPDLRTRTARNRLKSGSVRPQNAKRGVVVFKVPATTRHRSIELRGMDGPLATAAL